VRFRHLPEARYDKGGSRTNKKKQKPWWQNWSSACARPTGRAVPTALSPSARPSSNSWRTCSTTSVASTRNSNSTFGDEPPVEGEPVFVKNLENVQGDERDVILFSICYGPDESGKVSMNFGPLNRDGGERRLNVAITRAKHEVLVFSGLRADQIDLTRTRARGVRDLKHFLDYADRGPKALAAATTASSSAEADSEFERMVAARIRKAGYEVHHQVGCSGYRIDLGVVDPLAPGRYLLGHRMRRRDLPSRRHRPRPRQAPSAHPRRPRLEASPHLVHRLVARRGQGNGPAHPSPERASSGGSDREALTICGESARPA
jgi:hypothetical protein